MEFKISIPKNKNKQFIEGQVQFNLPCIINNLVIDRDQKKRV